MISGTPALQTRTLTFGKRIDFLGNPHNAAAVLPHGQVYRFSLDGNDPPVPIYRHDPILPAANCICYIANTHNSLVIGTAEGPVILSSSAGNGGLFNVTKIGNQKKPVDCIDVHPRGIDFAAAGPDTTGFFVYRHNCQYRHITTGINRITDLKYSPCGNYIAASKSKLFRFCNFAFSFGLLFVVDLFDIELVHGSFWIQ